MRKLLLIPALAWLALLAAPGTVHAQYASAVVVAACGTPPATYSPGSNRSLTQGTDGKLCDSGGGGGGSTTITGPLGRQADASSVSVGLSTEDVAILNSAVPACSANPCTTVIGNTGVVTNAVNGLVAATASAPITSTSATTTLVVAAAGSTKVYVTHYDWVVSGAGTVALIAGTGATCGGGTHYLTGAASHTGSFAANGGISAGGGLGAILITAAGEAVCIITTGAVDTAGSLSYAQF